MGFKDEVEKLSVQIKERKEHITNEEMTKQALIIPFIQLLGFDVFNPIEVRPEYSADFGNKKGEKVDYALFKDDEPIIFIEAKVVNEDLSNHDAQLSRYFNSATNVRLAILTNGIKYRFFTDLKTNNVMDDTPFLEIDFINLKDSDIENLNKLRKDTFDKDSLITYAEELVYTSALNQTLRTLFSNPSDEFIRFIIKDFSETTRVTSNVIDRFRPLVKKAISNAVLEIVSKGLYQDDDKSCKPEDDINDSSADQVSSKNNEEIERTKITATKQELQAFDTIKRILEENNRDVSDITYNCTTAYFSIYKKNKTKWIIRLNLVSSKKNIMTKMPITTIEKSCAGFEIEQAPKGIAESRIYIETADDLRKLKDLILLAYDYIN